MKRLALACLLASAGCMYLPGSIRPKATGRALPQDEHDQPLPQAVYYTDLGPAEIDVRAYPPVHQRNYQIFRAVCGDCHTLARAVNSPTQSRTYWRFHLARMSLHSRFQKGARLSPEDLEAVLDFLDHDAAARKVAGKAAFDAQDAELKRRFDPVLQQYLHDLQRKNEPPAP